MIDRTGQLEWHDHRIHWMSPAVPPEVKNQAKLTKIFDWQVPIQVGSSKGAVDGELIWTPESGTTAPTSAIVVLVAVVALGLLVVLVVRRRRAGGPPGAGSDPASAESRPGHPPREAW